MPRKLDFLLPPDAEGSVDGGRLDFLAGPGPVLRPTDAPPRLGTIIRDVPEQYPGPRMLPETRSREEQYRAAAPARDWPVAPQLSEMPDPAPWIERYLEAEDPESIADVMTPRVSPQDIPDFGFRAIPGVGPRLEQVAKGIGSTLANVPAAALDVARAIPAETVGRMAYAAEKAIKGDVTGAEDQLRQAGIVTAHLIPEFVRSWGAVLEGSGLADLIPWYSAEEGGEVNWSRLGDELREQGTSMEEFAAAVEQDPAYLLMLHPGWKMGGPRRPPPLPPTKAIGPERGTFFRPFEKQAQVERAVAAERAKERPLARQAQVEAQIKTEGRPGPAAEDVPSPEAAGPEPPATFGPGDALPGERGPLYDADRAFVEQTKPGERRERSYVTKEQLSAARKKAADLQDGDMIVTADGDLAWVVEGRGGSKADPEPMLVLYELDASGKPVKGPDTGWSVTGAFTREGLSHLIRGKLVRPTTGTGRVLGVRRGLAPMPENPGDWDAMARAVAERGGISDSELGPIVAENYGGKKIEGLGGIPKNMLNTKKGMTREDLAELLTQEYGWDWDRAHEYIDQWADGRRRKGEGALDTGSYEDYLREKSRSENQPQIDKLESWGVEKDPESAFGKIDEADQRLALGEAKARQVKPGDVILAEDAELGLERDVYRVKPGPEKGTVRLVDGKKYTLPADVTIEGVKLGEIGEQGLPRKPIKLRRARGPEDDSWDRKAWSPSERIGQLKAWIEDYPADPRRAGWIEERNTLRRQRDERSAKTATTKRKKKVPLFAEDEPTITPEDVAKKRAGRTGEAPPAPPRRGKHFTTPEVAAKLRAGEKFTTTGRSPYLPVDESPARWYPEGTLFLDAGEGYWSRPVQRRVGKGKVREFGRDEKFPSEDPTKRVFRDYDTQKWMIEEGGLEGFALESVEYEIDPKARTITVKDMASLKRLMDSTDITDYTHPDFWESVARKFDVVEIRNSKRYGHRGAPGRKEVGGHWRFWDMMTADQDIVLNPKVARLSGPEKPSRARPAGRTRKVIEDEIRALYPPKDKAAGETLQARFSELAEAEGEGVVRALKKELRGQPMIERFEPGQKLYIGNDEVTIRHRVGDRWAVEWGGKERTVSADQLTEKPAGRKRSRGPEQLSDQEIDAELTQVRKEIKEAYKKDQTPGKRLVRQRELEKEQVRRQGDHFSSGATAPADLAAHTRARRPAGVVAPRLTGDSLKAAEEHIRQGVRLFVDSGAFGKPVKDWNPIFKVYDRLVQVSRDSDAPAGRLFLVLPDVVGDQSASFSLIKRLAPKLRDYFRGGAENIVPVQTGALRPAEYAKAVLAELDVPRSEPRWGIPSNKAAMRTEEIRRFVKENEANPEFQKYHVLGAGKSKRGQEIVRVIKEANPEADVTTDAGTWRGQLGKGRRITLGEKKAKEDVAQEGFHGTGPAAGMDITETLHDLYNTPRNLPKGVYGDTLKRLGVENLKELRQLDDRAVESALRESLAESQKKPIGREARTRAVEAELKGEREGQPKLKLKAETPAEIQAKNIKLKKQAEAEAKARRKQKKSEEAGQEDMFDRASTERARDTIEGKKEQEKQGGLFGKEPGFPASAAERVAGTEPTLRGKPVPPKKDRRGLRLLKHRRTSEMKMIGKLELAMRAPVRRGRILKRALGIAKIPERVARLKTSHGKNVPVVSHETGHLVQKLLFPGIKQLGFDYKGKNSSRIRPELRDLGEDLYAPGIRTKIEAAKAAGDKDLAKTLRKRLSSLSPPGGYKSEGFAEFVRLWVTDRAKARKKAPAFYEAFTEALMRDDHTMRVARIFDEVAQDWQLYRDLPPAARMDSMISSGERRRRPLTLASLYRTFVDRTHYLHLAVKQMAGGRYEHHIGNPYTEMWLMRGMTGATQMALTEGIPDIGRNRLLGWLERHNLQTPGVRAGKDPIWYAPQKGAAARDLNIELQARRLWREYGRGDTPLLEIRGRGKDAQLYLTKKGADSLSERTFERLGPGLRQILASVADEPHPFLGELLKNETRARQLAEQFGDWILDKDMHRGVKSFRLYMLARHAKGLLDAYLRDRKRYMDAVERGDKKLPPRPRWIETGIPESDWAPVLKHFDSPKFREAFKKLQVYQDTLLLQAVEAGILPADQLPLWKAANPDYIPLNRFIEGEPRRQVSGRAGRPEAGRVFRRRKGADLPIVDPLEQIIANTFAIYNEIASNQVKRFLHEYAEEHPGSGWAVERIPKKQIPASFKLSEIKREIARAIEEAGGEIPDGLDLEIQARIWRPETVLPKVENAVAYWKDGKQVWIRLDRELYRLFSGLDEDTAHVIARWLGPFARGLRAGTTLSPGFIARNIIRDAMTAGVFAHRGFWPFVDTARGVAMVTRERMGKPIEGDWMFKFRASGASLAHYLAQDRKYFQTSLRSALKNPRLSSRVLSADLHPVEALRTFSQIMEEATRAQVFRRHAESVAKDKGLPVNQDALLQAAIQARDTTLDFSRAGTLGREWNQVAAFLNAAIQGIDKTGRVLIKEQWRENPKFAARAMAFVVLPSLVEWALNRKREDYYGLADYQKDLYWNLPLPARLRQGVKIAFVAIPKPFEAGLLFGSSVTRLLHYIDTHDPHELDAFADSLLESLLPSVIPTLFGALVDNAVNRSAFFGRTIVPQREADLEASLRFGPWTSDVAKAGAAVARKLPGAKFGVTLGYEPTAQISPRQVDHLIRSWGGSASRDYLVPAGDVVVRALLEGTALGDELGIGKGLRSERSWIEQMFRSFAIREDQVGRGAVDRFYAEWESSETARRSFYKIPEERQEDWLQREDRRRRVVSSAVLRQYKARIDLLQSHLHLATTQGDRDAALDVWKRIVHQAREALDAAHSIADYESELRALRISKAERLEEAAQSRVRNEHRVVIEEFLLADDEQGALAYVADLDEAEQQAATAYLKRRLRESALSPEERALEKVPKKRRETIKLRALGE